MLAPCIRQKRTCSLWKMISIRVRNFVTRAKQYLKKKFTDDRNQRNDTRIPVRGYQIPKKTEKRKSKRIEKQKAKKKRKIEIITIDISNPIEKEVANYLQEDKAERKAYIDQKKAELQANGHRDGYQHDVSSDSSDGIFDDDFEVVLVEEATEGSIQEGHESELP